MENQLSLFYCDKKSEFLVRFLSKSILCGWERPWSSGHHRRVLDIRCQIDSSECLAQLTPARVGIARSVHGAIGGITTCRKMRHSLSLSTVTYICMGELPHFHHSPTTSFLHSQPIQTPPSGPGLLCAAGQMFIWDDPSGLVVKL